MVARALGFPVYDADNHMYETRDALTKYLPKEFKGKVGYVDVDGRPKLVVNNHISHMIPNPTFERVARPGSAEDYFLGKNPDGKTFPRIHRSRQWMSFPHSSRRPSAWS